MVTSSAASCCRPGGWSWRAARSSTVASARLHQARLIDTGKQIRGVIRQLPPRCWSRTGDNHEQTSRRPDDPSPGAQPCALPGNCPADRCRSRQLDRGGAGSGPQRAVAGCGPAAGRGDRDPGPEDLYQVGTVANLLRYLTAPDGAHHVVCQGVRRFRIKDFLEGQPYLAARIELIPDEEATTTEIAARAHQLRERAQEAIQLCRRLSRS